MKETLTKEKLMRDLNEELFSIQLISLLFSIPSVLALIVLIINIQILPKELYVLIPFFLGICIFPFLYKQTLFFLIQHNKFRIRTDSVARKYEDEKRYYVD